MVTEDVVDRVVVGRQSIHDRQLDVVGYELRFSPAESGDAAAHGLTRDVLFGALTIGLDRLVGDKRLFCNAGRDLLVGDTPLTLLPARTVVEIGPDLHRAGALPAFAAPSGSPAFGGSAAVGGQAAVVAPAAPVDEAVLAGVRRLARQGFIVALDDFRWSEGAADLLELARIVKIDAAAVTPAELEQLIDRCRGFDLQLLATNVESAAQLEALRAAGFDLFQGFALQRPSFASGRAMAAVGDLSRLQRATGVLGQVLDFDEIEDILRTDPGLTYQVLRLASMGRPGETRRPVSTVRDALVRVGSWRIQSWIALLLSRGGAPIPEDAIVVALTRARACEVLAARDGLGARLGFTAGMVSSFEQLLQIPASELCASLPLSDELREAAFGDSTPLARVVRDVADQQDGRMHGLHLSGLSRADIDAALAGAFTWALEATDALSG